MRSTFGWIGMGLFIILFLLPVTLVRCRPSEDEGHPSGVLVRIYSTQTGRLVTMDLENYVKGVVAAEMPANFEPEALKAQAVAARTITVRRMKQFGGEGSRRNPSADFSDDPSEGQAWCDQRQLRAEWGLFNYRSNWARICRAVDETRGIIITYEGKPIDAVFHSTSGPRTENSEDVWGRFFPYLRSVECPYDRESPRYYQQLAFSRGELARLTGVQLSSHLFDGTIPVTSGRYGVQVVERSVGGRVKWVRLGGVMFRGEDFRRALGLRSARLSCMVKGGKLWISTVGYGHGVGLCQYGANGMAKAGYDFRSILHYYYTGVELRRLLE